MTAEVVSSALEQWTLHTLAVGAIVVGFLAFALVLAGAGYRDMVRSRLTLRLTNETLHAIWDVVADVLLFESVLMGFVLFSRDVMSEVALPLPLLPLATLALLIGLGLRAFYGGRVPGARAWWGAVGLIGTACALNWIGLSYVMNGPDAEWLSRHPSAVWSFWFSLRSNENPGLAAQTFLWMQPALLIACLWLVVSALRRVRHRKEVESLSALENASVRNYFEVHVDSHLCTACAICVDACPQHGLSTKVGDGSPELVNGHCDGCGICVEQCPTQALRVLTRQRV